MQIYYANLLLARYFLCYVALDISSINLFVCFLHQFRNKFKINRYPSLPITPKGVMNEIHHHIFYQYVTSGDVIGGRPQGIAPTDKTHQMYIVTIMQSALTMTRILH